MNRIGVLGIGNRLMMDDGIGIYVVEELAKKNKNPILKYIVGETDIDYCLDQIKLMKKVIVIDAAHLGMSPGVVAEIPLQQLRYKKDLLLTAHNIHLLDYIKSKGESIDGIFIGIEPYQLAYGMHLSQRIEEQLTGIVNLIEENINKYITLV